MLEVAAAFVRPAARVGPSTLAVTSTVGALASQSAAGTGLLLAAAGLLTAALLLACLPFAGALLLGWLGTYAMVRWLKKSGRVRE